MAAHRSWNYTVSIKWSQVRHLRKSPLLKKRGVLYMFATAKRSCYIGEAIQANVRQRYDEHKTDGVIEWIEDNIPLWVETCRLRVGELRYNPKKVEDPDTLLHDVQNFLIYDERWLRSACLANVMSTSQRSKYRPGMRILNIGDYKPLWRLYLDNDRWFVLKLGKHVHRVLKAVANLIPAPEVSPQAQRPVAASPRGR